MQKRSWFVALMILAVALIMACSLGSSAAESPPEAQPPEEAPAPEVAPQPIEEDAPVEAAEISSDFPLPDDAENVMDLGEGALNFQTELSLPDVMTFYRDAFTQAGYTERELLTSFEDPAFNLVFDGHPSGKAIVIQGGNLGESVNVNIRFEDI